MIPSVYLFIYLFFIGNGVAFTSRIVNSSVRSSVVVDGSCTTPDDSQRLVSFRYFHLTISSSPFLFSVLGFGLGRAENVEPFDVCIAQRRHADTTRPRGKSKQEIVARARKHGCYVTMSLIFCLPSKKHINKTSHVFVLITILERSIPCNRLQMWC